VKRSLQEGDILYIEFYGKALQPKKGTAIGQVMFRYASLIFPVILDTTWKKYSSYAIVKQNVNPSNLWIHCSFEPQSISLAGIRLYQFNASTDVSKFKNLTPLYATDGSWEATADKRIDSLRKGQASFVLRDDHGEPLPGCAYKVEMIRHAFKFGTAIDPNLITGNTQNAEKYRNILKQDFNHAVFEDHLKWLTWNNKEERRKALLALEWLENNEFIVRGHTLVWPWFDFPWKLIELNFDTLALKASIMDHLAEKTSILEGRLIDWDVLNEPFVIRNKPHKDNSGVWLYKDVCEVVGKEEVLRWYNKAHEIDSGARLFINDYDMVADGGNFEQHKDDFEAFIAMLIENQVPLGGIGFQGHFEGYLTRPDRVYQVIDRFARFNLPILITEFDTDISKGHDDELYQFTHDFLKICFSHPGIDGFLNWGFWAGKHWKPDAAFYDKDWNQRVNGKAWRDLIYHEWWTIEEGKTGNKGEVSFRGFLGDYRLTFMQNGMHMERTFSLGREGITWK
jgi:GH35 family endo-1,4-beta-xylanase